MKKMTLLYHIFWKVNLGTDVFLTIYNIGKKYNINSEIVTFDTDKIKLLDNYRGVRFKKFKEINFGKEKYYLIREFRLIRHLIINAKKIDFLMMFHMSKKTTVYSLIYKFFNKDGKIYIKLDMSEGTLASLEKMKNFRIRTFLIKKFFKVVDLYSIENKKLYDKFPDNFKNIKNIRKKLIHIPNGFDEEKLKELDLKVKTYEEKENIMIVVGRIGSLQKNNEMLLKILNNLDLKDWKIYFLGPYTPEFKKLYTEFINNNLDKKDKVLLKGNIEDKRTLYSYYNKSKVFLHTSNYEGFALVFPEALRFGNYILSTDVGGAKDVTNFGEIGKIVNIKDEKEFKNQLIKILEGQVDLKENCKKSIKRAEKIFNWEKIISNYEFKKFFK